MACFRFVFFLCPHLRDAGSRAPCAALRRFSLAASKNASTIAPAVLGASRGRSRRRRDPDYISVGSGGSMGTAADDDDTAAAAAKGKRAFPSAALSHPSRGLLFPFLSIHQGRGRHRDPLARVRGGRARVRQGGLARRAPAVPRLPRRRHRGRRGARPVRAVSRQGAGADVEDGRVQEDRRKGRRW